MTRQTLLTTLLVSLAFTTVVTAALKPPDHPLFNGDAVHEIHLTFHQTDWWNQLTYNYENYEDIPYIEAEFDWESIHFNAIGVRFKGNSSYFGYTGLKKSFNLDIDEFVLGQVVYGLDKLLLNNCYLDPSFVREKCAYELCEAAGLPTERTNYAALYINGAYWGLYLLVEQFDQEFIESRFGAAEEGNLWKSGDDGATLEYLGSTQSSYYCCYELKTNEVENDWSACVNFVDVINNYSIGSLPDTIHVLLDVNSAMAMLAVDNYAVNLDSYVGRGANYYFYHRDLDGRFVFAKWDLNESWGIFNRWNLSLTQMKQLSPYWVNPSIGEDRPLAERLWQIDQYDDLYIGHLKKLLSGAGHPDTLRTRMVGLQSLIRSWVYADTNNMFSNTNFDNSLTSDIYASGGPPPGKSIPGLNSFISGRYTYLSGLIGAWTRIDGLVLNEVMSSNNATVTDNVGDYEDWIEVANISASAINLSGLILTDHWEGTPDFVFPATTLQPGEYIVVWADEEPGEGSLHAPFKLDGDGEEVYLIDGQVIVDQVTFPNVASNVSWGRWPNGSGDWQMLSLATPKAENLNPEEPEEITLLINEILAINETWNQDEVGGYGDWVEIYNPGPEAVDLLGLFLTDDLANTTQWSFPDTTIGAGELMLIWCDNDPEDGPLHTTFKFSGDGEEIGIFGRLASGNQEIDTYVFGSQSADVSEGRGPNGSDTWCFFEAPTPDQANSDCNGGLVCGDANGDAAVDISDVVYLVVYIFQGGSAPSPLLAGDANCDSAVDISDVVYLIARIFSGGPAPCDPNRDGLADC